MWSTKFHGFIFYNLAAATHVWGQLAPVDSKDFPWLVAVYVTADYHPIGTGLIITKNWVLTPGHFWLDKRFTERNSAVNYGATVNREGEGKVGRINSIFVHPFLRNLDTDTAYDVALLHLKPAMELEWRYGEVFPIDEENLIRPAGDKCYVTGYGMDYHERAEDIKPRQLRTMMVEVKWMDRCIAKMPFPQEMFCAGPVLGANLCPGYEGAIIKCGKKFYGMFVKGMACPSDDERINVYLRLGTMRDFIMKEMVSN